MKSNWALLLLLASLLCTIVPGSSHGMQGDALTRLMKAKRNAGSNFIDVSLYDAGALTSEVAIVPQVGSKDNDKIVKLPGQPDVNFNQYGGYITVNEKAGRALFYYFAEATGYQQSSKPLLLWLNGGPGCSSLAYGAMEELGPFRVSSDGETLNRNPYSWNKVANVLFLESPAGVGFSYSNRTEDYKTSGDKKTAQDAFVFLVNWLERFPEYKNREFYIAGESYAGHYVPQLGHAILKHNEAAKRTLVNLKGVMIGNAVINDETDSLGMYEFFWTHALISDEDWQQIRTNCDFAPNVTKQSANCNKATDEADVDLDDLDIYNIYAPLCHSTNTTLKPKKSSVMKFDPCSDYYVIKYLNLPKVQKALHANVTKVNFSWQPCSDVITKWADSPSTILPLLQEFLATGIRVWVFSGDTDGRVPITGTRYSLNVLKLPVKTQWKPWYVNDEIGGYSVVYKGDLVLATVRGAGHMVPSYQPRRALVLANSFLQGKPLPPQ